MMASLYELFIYAKKFTTIKEFKTVNVFICTDDAIQSLKDIFLAQLLFITLILQQCAATAHKTSRWISKTINTICEEQLQQQP